MIAGLVSLFACGTCEKEDKEAEKETQEVIKADEPVAPDTLTVTEDQRVEEVADTVAKIEE